jgi:hypothetical protein
MFIACAFAQGRAFIQPFGVNLLDDRVNILGARTGGPQPQKNRP